MTKWKVDPLSYFIRFLREADCVIHMEDGLIHNYGTPEQILPSVEDKNMEGSSGQGVVNSNDKKDLETSQASSKESDSVVSDFKIPLL